MKKIITYLILIILIIAGILFFLTRVPAVQDALFQRLAISLIGTTPNIFPEEDSLIALVCGSKSPLPHPTRAETCVMIKAGDETFIFDVGNKSIDNLRNWRVPLDQLNGIFISHLHSDHIAELPEIHMWSWVGTGRQSKLKVYGPEGINQVLRGFTEAYSLDWKFRNDHHGDDFAPLRTAGFDGYEINNFNAPVYESNGIKITAFLVEHNPVDPSLAFKIEYKERSIVLSGDTIYSESVLNNSKNVDVLFHEAFHKETLDMMYNALPENSSLKVALVDIQNYHTNTIEVANIAKEANVGHLVYYHLIPAPRTNLVADIFTRGIDDILTNWTLSNDGTMVILPVDSKEIIITSIN